MKSGELTAVGYARVSTSKKSVHSTPDRIVFEQSLEAQEQAIRERATVCGWNLLEVYSDRTSGAKEKRPGLDALLDAARRHKFRVLVVPRLDRLARSLQQLVNLMVEFQDLKISFVSLKENIETETAAGRAMFGMLALFSAFERDIMRERIVAGMAHASAHGTKSGQPPGRPRRVFDWQQAVSMRETGEGWDTIAARLGVSVSTLWRHVKQGKLKSPMEEHHGVGK